MECIEKVLQTGITSLVNTVNKSLERKGHHLTPLTARDSTSVHEKAKKAKPQVLTGSDPLNWLIYRDVPGTNAPGF